MLTQDLLRKELNYDPNSGLFTRATTTRANSVAGSVACSLHARTGYRCVLAHKRRYQAHRLVWLYVYGRWPTSQIDHINLDKSDNRLSNLREATASENMMNTHKNSRNTSGHRGVSWNQKAKRWEARTVLAGKSVYLGAFTDKSDAVDAYQSYVQVAHGPFYRSDQ